MAEKGKIWRVQTPPDDPEKGLNIRSAPGGDWKFLVPNTHFVESTGQVRGSWYEVVYRGDAKKLRETPKNALDHPPVESRHHGWVHSAHLHTSADPRADYKELTPSPPLAGPVPPKALVPPKAYPPEKEVARERLAQTHPEEAQLLKLINDYRAIHGLPPWKITQNLLETTRAHVVDMAGQERDTDKGSDGSDSFKRIKAKVANLNTAWGLTAFGERPEGVLKKWLSTADQKRFLLHPQFTSVGVAKTGNYWALNMSVRMDETAVPQGPAPDAAEKNIKFMQELEAVIKRHGEATPQTRFAQDDLRAKPQSVL